MVMNLLDSVSYSFFRLAPILGMPGWLRTGGITVAIVIVVLIIIGAMMSLAEKKHDHTKKVKEWEQLCPISEDTVINMFFLSFDHATSCTAPQYAHGSKDQPSPCVDAFLDDDEDMSELSRERKLYCKYCNGKVIAPHEKAVSIRTVNDICYKFLDEAIKVCGRDGAVQAMARCHQMIAMNIAIALNTNIAVEWQSWKSEYIDRRQTADLNETY